MNRLLEKLPREIGDKVQALPESVNASMEEIRFRAGFSPVVFAGGREYVLSGNTVSTELLNNIFNLILNYSVYAYEEELKNGYISMEGGHRAGICGRVVMEQGKVKTIKDISSLNLRRNREIPGIADPFVPFLWTGRGPVKNTLIVSPPKCGKTTLLRDFIRYFSAAGFKVGVCDERSELAGSFRGQAAYDLGPRADVLDGCPKSQGMIMLIRAMAPDIIATDEIGRSEDCRAVEEALGAGVSLLTTIHGNSMDNVLHSGIGPLVKRGAFQRFLFLTDQPKTGSLKVIRDEKNAIIWSGPC